MNAAKPPRSDPLKPLPRPPGPPPQSVAAVRHLLARLDALAETFGVVALDDPTLAGLAAAVSGAADLAGEWLTDHGARVPVTASPEPSDRPSAAERVRAGKAEPPPHLAEGSGRAAPPPSAKPDEIWGVLFAAPA